MLICHLSKAFRHGVPWNFKKPAAHGSKIAPTRIVFFVFFWVLEEVRFGLGINLGNIIFGESLERYSKGKNAFCVRSTFVEFPINFCFAPRYIANHANIFLIFKLALFSLIKWWMYWVETKLDYLFFWIASFAQFRRVPAPFGSLLSLKRCNKESQTSLQRMNRGSFSSLSLASFCVITWCISWEKSFPSYLIRVHSPFKSAMCRLRTRLKGDHVFVLVFWILESWSRIETIKVQSSVMSFICQTITGFQMFNNFFSLCLHGFARMCSTSKILCVSIFSR